MKKSLYLGNIHILYNYISVTWFCIRYRAQIERKAYKQVHVYLQTVDF